MSITFRNILHLLVKKPINIIFPPRCLLCDKIVSEEGKFCQNCWQKMRFLSKPACEICFQPFDLEIEEQTVCGKCMQKRPRYEQARAVFIYNKDSRRLITSFKYSDNTHLAKHLTKQMCIAGDEIIKKSDFIVPVPLHKKRLVARKYNQSALLANEISKMTNLPVEHDILKRTKHNRPQVGLKWRDRLKNIKGAFSINTKMKPEQLSAIRNKNALLIDDVMTTGATIDNCVKVLLKDGGVKKVYVLTVARTVKY